MLLDPCTWSAKPPVWNLVGGQSATLNLPLEQGVFVHVLAQSQATSTTSTPAPTSGTYVNSASVPGPVRGYLAAFGDRIQKPGNERTILVGTYTDGNGATQAQITWQAPGSIRIDRANQPGRPLIYSAAKAAVVVPLQAAESNALESFLDDTAEAFFYGFQGGTSYRLLGQRFRVDDGRTANYQGPWYGVYAGVGSASAQPGKPSRIKHYYFDSQTALLMKTRYVSSATVTVTTEFGNWTKIEIARNVVES